MAIENSVAQITSDSIKAKLLQHDRYGKLGKDNFALISKKNFQIRKNVKCYKCGLTGHFIQDDKNKNQKHERVSNYEDKNSKMERALNTIDLDASQFSWYIDSGATQHKSHQKEIFNNFEQKYCGQIMVANNQRIVSAGIGNVTISIKNGPKM